MCEHCGIGLEGFPLQPVAMLGAIRHWNMKHTSHDRYADTVKDVVEAYEWRQEMQK